MKILLTGAGGFLGSEILAQAVKQGDEVRALARRQSTTVCSSVEWIVSDLTALPADLSPFMQGIDAVIHCAAATSATQHTLQESRLINVVATGRLFEAACAAKVPRWIQISSMSAHAGSTSVYGKTKLEADEILYAAGVKSPTVWTILKPDLIYGPGDRGLVAKTLNLARRLPALPIVGSGAERLRPVFVADVAAAALKCIKLDQTAGKTYVIGGADETSIEDFLRRLLDAADVRRTIIHLPAGLCMAVARILSTCVKRPPLTVDNVRAIRELVPADHALASREWGWTPLGLEEGLKRAFQ